MQYIFIADGAGHDQALTHGKSVNTQPAWAADGTRLAFTSNREGLTKIYLYGRRIESAAIEHRHPHRIGAVLALTEVLSPTTRDPWMVPTSIFASLK